MLMLYPVMGQGLSEREVHDMTISLQICCDSKLTASGGSKSNNVAKGFCNQQTT